MTSHLCHIFPSFGTGGPEVRTALLINSLGDAFRHSIVALNGNVAGQERLAKADAVAFVPPPPRHGRLRHPIDLSHSLRALAPDAVLTYGWGGTDGILAARLAGLRRILHAEDGFLPEESHRQKWSRQLARRVLLQMAARVVVPSQVLVGICRQSWKLPDAKVRFVPNGIDTIHHAPPTREVVITARERLGLPASALVVGTVGRLGAEKNPGRLLRAFQAVARQFPAWLLVAGDGPLRGELEKAASEAGLADRVRFVGNVNDPRDCYRAMDVFALSSDTEQMPLVVLEAMATGLPVISTNVGDVRHMVAPGNPVVAAGAEENYRLDLATLLGDGELRRSLGASNLAKCRARFDLTSMIEAYRRLYADVLESKHE